MEKVTFEKILQAMPALRALCGERMAMQEAVNLSRLIKGLERELEVFNEKKEALFAAYPDEEARKSDDFDKECKALLQAQVDAPKEITVHLQTVTAAMILATEGFVNFEEG